MVTAAVTKEAATTRGMKENAITREDAATKARDTMKAVAAMEAKDTMTGDAATARKIKISRR